MSGLLKKLTGKQGKQNKTRDRKLRNFLCLFCWTVPATFPLSAPGLPLFKTEVIPPPLLVKSTEMGWQRKSKWEAFLPLLLFSPEYPRVIYILISQTPPPVSQLAAYSAFRWGQHMLRLEQPVNVRPGHWAHRGKDFQLQRPAGKIRARNTERRHLSTTLEKPTCSSCGGDDLNSLATPTAGAQPQIQWKDVNI